MVAQRQTFTGSMNEVMISGAMRAALHCIISKELGHDDIRTYYIHSLIPYLVTLKLCFCSMAVCLSLFKAGILDGVSVEPQ